MDDTLLTDDHRILRKNNPPLRGTRSRRKGGIGLGRPTPAMLSGAKELGFASK